MNKERLWVVGRYPNGGWDSGGKEDEYLGGWTCKVLASDRVEALKKGKAKYYRERKTKE
jgi:hypothetical protein